MEITDISTTKVGSESWGEFVEFPAITCMNKYEEYRNVDGDDPQFRREFQGPVGDVVVEVETDAGITGIGHANWGVQMKLFQKPLPCDLRKVEDEFPEYVPLSLRNSSRCVPTRRSTPLPFVSVDAPETLAGDCPEPVHLPFSI